MIIVAEFNWKEPNGPYMLKKKSHSVVPFFSMIVPAPPSSSVDLGFLSFLDGPLLPLDILSVSQIILSEAK